jgi:hypothetical protein
MVGLRDHAMFDLAIDSKLRGCDVVKVKVGDLVSGGRVRSRSIVVQQKTGQPVQFELPELSRRSILAWPAARWTSSSSQAESIIPGTSALGGMRDLLMSGWSGSDCAGNITEPILCAEPRRPSSICGQATCALFT